MDHGQIKLTENVRFTPNLQTTIYYHFHPNLYDAFFSYIIFHCAFFSTTYFSICSIFSCYLYSFIFIVFHFLAFSSSMSIYCSLSTLQSLHAWWRSQRDLKFTLKTFKFICPQDHQNALVVLYFGTNCFHFQVYKQDEYLYFSF